MLSGWKTIWYFLWRGFTHGGVMGGIAGTFVFPIYGTFVGGAWGAGVGLVMGLLLGIGVHFYNRYAYRQQMDFEEYQANLVTGAGLATTLITALPLLILLAPVAGLVAAYVTHRYADDHAQHIIKRKNEGLQPDTLAHMEKRGSIEKFSDFFEARMKWIFRAGLIALPLVSMVIGIADSDINVMALVISSILGWVIYMAAVTTLIGSTNGIFIQMLNRVVSSPDLTKEQYKRRVMVTAGLFTLVITPVVGLFVGAPILSIIATLAARDYADWYFGDNETTKSKRDASRLSDEYTADDDDEVIDDIVDEEKQRLSTSLERSE